MGQDPKKIIVYGNPFCMMVGPVRAIFDRSNVPYEYVDITRNPQATVQVKQINNGYASVPTLVFPDDSTLTEPTIGQLRKRLQDLGYQVSDLTFLDNVSVVMNNPYTYFFGIILIVFGFAGNNNSLVVLGTILLVLGLLLRLRYGRS